MFLVPAVLAAVTAALALKPIASIRRAWAQWRAKPVVLRAASGAEVHILPVGAVIQRLLLPDEAGVLGDVVLGFDSVAPYQACSQCTLFCSLCSPRRQFCCVGGVAAPQVCPQAPVCERRTAPRHTLGRWSAGAPTALLEAASRWRSRAAARATTSWPSIMSPTTCTAARPRPLRAGTVRARRQAGRGRSAVALPCRKARQSPARYHQVPVERTT